MRARNRMLAGFGALLAAAGMVLTAPAKAHADYNPGCQTVLWGFLGSQRRTICDGPIEGDGGWQRARVIWTPAHQVPATTTCGSYSCSTYGGYWVDKTINRVEEYRVYPSNVLSDEPDHLAAGIIL